VQQVSGPEVGGGRGWACRRRVHARFQLREESPRSRATCRNNTAPGDQLFSEDKPVELLNR